MKVDFIYFDAGGGHRAGGVVGRGIAWVGSGCLRLNGLFPNKPCVTEETIWIAIDERCP
jgi:hypothetical protein